MTGKEIKKLITKGEKIDVEFKESKENSTRMYMNQYVPLTIAMVASDIRCSG